MRVTAFPTLGIRDLRAPKSWPHQQVAADASFWFRGSSAIVQAVRALGLTANDEILVPTYHCGVEVDALRQAGSRIRFVPVTRCLQIDPVQLRMHIGPSTRAVMVIHYFGFPQRSMELRALCDELGLILIEDCAHALFSRSGENWLGAVGHASVFSFQKTLPVSDGGALVTANSANMPRGAAPPWSNTARLITLLLLARGRSRGRHLEVLSQTLLRSGRFVRRLMRRSHGSRHVTPPNPLALDVATIDRGMSQVALRILRNADAGDIVAARRRNYAALVGALRKIDAVEIPFSDLPEGVCPLFLPLLVKKRADLRDWLLSRGIETFIFGEFPHALLATETCEVANRWSRENLCLPVHQDLTPVMLNTMVQAFNEWSLADDSRAAHVK